MAAVMDDQDDLSLLPVEDFEKTHSLGRTVALVYSAILAALILILVLCYRGLL